MVTVGNLKTSTDHGKHFLINIMQKVSKTFTEFYKRLILEKTSLNFFCSLQSHFFLFSFTFF